MASTVDLAYTLDDRYVRQEGRIYLDGDQAIVRLLITQRMRDQAAGLNTAGFVAGYRGSPLGVLDMALWKASKHLERNQVHFQPSVNEDLAATAVGGTQQINSREKAKYDGVFGMWYGKGPGVDRAGDALKTANYAGTAKFGGVLALCGDDHGMRSSSTAHQSEQALIHFNMPVLNPSSIQEYIDLGLYGYAMSRFSGLWVGFLCVTDTVETAASVAIDPDRVDIVLPAIEGPDRNTGRGFGGEQMIWRNRLPAAQAFVRANRLDRVAMGSADARLGIVTCGKSYNDVGQALTSLGISESRARELGLAVYKVAMTWPLEAEGIREFARGKTHLLFVEEKRPLVEDQVKAILYGDAVRPQLNGKRDWNDQPLVSNDGEFNSSHAAEVIAKWLGHVAGVEVSARTAPSVSLAGAPLPMLTDLNRAPGFCSGCPHNTSTKLPDGSIAMGGTGCHGMVGAIPERRTQGGTQMGGEGANWVGMAPFMERSHMFQNMGDGTYFHSGLLAIRYAVSAGVNITYKLLANSAIAMTGGQAIEGSANPVDMALQVAAEGVKRIAVVSDYPDRSRAAGQGRFPADVTFHHRDELDEVQRTLRDIPGTTVLIYDQECAAELRRKRKRGTLPEPEKRVIINELVCEGCGDCNVQSNCISVEPIDTDLGRKRHINQSSCNKDYLCVDGYCPSFVTVTGGTLRSMAAAAPKPAASRGDGGFGPLPAPRVLENATHSTLVTGIGGAGIITLGGVMAMAAHLEGKGVTVLNVLGMAQKNGPVTSHLTITADPDTVRSSRIGPGGAHLILGTDPIVTAAPDSMNSISAGKTTVILNTHIAPTIDFAQKPNLKFDSDPIAASLRKICGDDYVHAIPATHWATRLFGDTIAMNMFLIGVASQSGLLPVGPEALLRAIELNGAAVKMNQEAFEWGRRAAAFPEEFRRFLDGDGAEKAEGGKAAVEPLDALIARRAAFLTKYQDVAYADRYRAFVEGVRAAESRVTGTDDLAKAVANYYFKLLAYKDEYEVARLMTGKEFRDQVAKEFSGNYKLSLNLAPQVFNSRHPRTGRAKKRQFGAWMFPVLRVMAAGRRLRGTPFDLFGMTAHRRHERALIADYEKVVGELSSSLTVSNHELAVRIASLPDTIRGYDLIKDATAAKAEEQTAQLLEEFRSPQAEKEPELAGKR